MNHTSFSTSRWLFELTKTFLKGAPISTPMSVFTTLISQIAMMLAFLMPLKVIMLLGVEGTPSYFPDPFNAIEKNTLIIFLVVLSVASYTLSELLKIISAKMTDLGVKKLLGKTRKIIIFENQDNFASKAYTRYTDALAGLVFSLVTFGFFFIFYKNIALFTIAVLFIAYLLTYIFYLSYSNLKSIISENPQPVAISISNVVFFLLFLYVVIDFLYFTPPEFIVGLITIIIGRLMLVRLSFTASYLFTLKQDEGKINALFFHNQAFIPAIKSNHKSVWDLLSHDAIQSWVAPILEKTTGEKNIEDIVTKWHQTHINNIVILKAESKSLGKTFLVKLFEKKLASQAQHESTLMLDEFDSDFPCPPFLLATMVGSYHCHIFDITDYEVLSFRETQKLNNSVNEQLLIFRPSKEIIERYKRSKAFLWERFEKGMMDRLRLIGSEKDKLLIQEFEHNLPEIKSILQTLPLSFVAPKSRNLSLLKDSEDRTVCFHWPAWVIEPTGAGINFKNKKSSNMENIIRATHERRTELIQFPNECYELASLLFEFENTFHRQQYEDAIELLQQSLIKLYGLMHDKA